MKDRFTIRFKEKELLNELKYLSFVVGKSTNKFIQDILSKEIKNYSHTINKHQNELKHRP